MGRGGAQGAGKWGSPDVSTFSCKGNEKGQTEASLSAVPEAVCLPSRLNVPLQAHQA